MSHLNLETLARLVDDAPDPTEAGHLDICETCRNELEALRADAAALRMLPDPEPPIAQWVALEQRLAREGLLRRTSFATTALRMAATLAIFIAGALAGVLVMKQTAAPVVAGERVNGRAGERALVTSVNNSIDDSIRPLAPSPALPLAAATPAEPRTAEEAVARLRDAEQSYLAALARFSEFSARPQTTDPVARLAALESIVATTRAALGQAPADPVINGYHLTAVAQRDATLRQLAASGQTWY